MILARLPQGLVDQLASFEEIAGIPEETAGALGRLLVRPQAVFEDL